MRRSCQRFRPLGRGHRSEGFNGRTILIGRAFSVGKRQARDSAFPAADKSHYPVSLWLLLQAQHRASECGREWDLVNDRAEAPVADGSHVPKR